MWNKRATIIVIAAWLRHVNRIAAWSSEIVRPRISYEPVSSGILALFATKTTIENDDATFASKNAKNQEEIKSETKVASQPEPEYSTGHEHASSWTTSFVSPMFQCYIEDTDSYGVIYNANYLRSFDRALHAMYRQEDALLQDDNDNSKPQQRLQQKQSVMMYDHEDWSIVHVDKQKFITSPKLGGTYCIHGTLVKHGEEMEVWDLSMKESEDPNSMTFNAAQITIARPGVFATPKKILMERSTEKSVVTKDIFRLFRDEFDSHFPTHVPLRNVLTLFERSRSNYLGGPDCLRKLKDDHRLLFVVTKVNNCCKFPLETELSPGNLVVVQTAFEVKRKGMIIDCHHILKAHNQPVAQATVTLMTLNADTFKPSTNLPDWLLDLLQA